MGVVGGDALLFAGLAAAAFFRIDPALIAAFVLLDVLHNLWRPIQLGRFDTHGREEQGATLLSIESQARRLATVITAPLLGLAVDTVKSQGPGGPFWPVGILGCGVALGFFFTRPAVSREKGETYG